MSWFEHGDSRIYYEEYGAGEPLLLLPGFSQSGDDLSALRDALAARYRVIVADLPGSGRSQPLPRTYTASYYEDDARSFAGLLEHLGVASAYVAGFSDGGEVALLMAALTPDLTRSAVTWGAAGKISDPDGSLRQVMNSLVDHPIPPLQGYRDFLVGRYGEANARAMTQNQTDGISAVIEAGGELAMAKAEQMTCPVLLITGEHDMFAPPTLAEELAVRIPHAETIIVKGAGHDVQNSHPDWLARTILDWLERN
ncbi:MAG TPA: alpha/beta hydrolase [Ktedonobacterales bacterium]|jgi:valacyclovir hydrolase